MDFDSIKGAANELGGRLQQGFGRATGDRSTQAEGLAREAVAKVQSAVGSAREQAGALADDVGDTLRDAADATRRYAADGADRLEAGARQAARTVERHPLAVIVAAAGLGFALATILHIQADSRSRSFFGRR